MRNYFLMHIIKYSRVHGVHRRDSRLGSARGRVTVTVGKETYRPSVSVRGEFERKIYASDRSARRYTAYLNSPLKFLITSWTLYFSARWPADDGGGWRETASIANDVVNAAGYTAEQRVACFRSN